ncbi:MAG: HNH endonuclease [Nostoc sp.]
MKARDFIKPGEEILVLMTGGALLEFGEDNTALTGDWVINPYRSTDRVIIYRRNNDTTNTLYIGNRSDVILVQDKYKIQLTHVQYIGKTILNWFEFAETHSHSVRYIS